VQKHAEVNVNHVTNLIISSEESMFFFVFLSVTGSNNKGKCDDITGYSSEHNVCEETLVSTRQTRPSSPGRRFFRLCHQRSGSLPTKPFHLIRQLWRITAGHSSNQLPVCSVESCLSTVVFVCLTEDVQTQRRVCLVCLRVLSVTCFCQRHLKIEKKLCTLSIQ